MSIRPMTVRVRSVPPCVSVRSPTVREGSARNDALAYARASDTICVSSQIGSRHLPLKQGIVSSSLTWRTNFISGCGVTQASESWELVVTVQFCPPRPKTLPIANVRLPIGLPHGINRQWQSKIDNASAPVAQMEERDASNVEVAGSSPARSSM